MKKVILFVLIMSLLGTVFALDFVAPDMSEREYFLHLVPGQTYTISFLAQDSTGQIEMKNVNCDTQLQCTNVRKDGPYYYLDISVKEEGVFNIDFAYTVNGVADNDRQKVIVDYEYVVAESIVEAQREFGKTSKIRFVILNNSDSDLELNIVSSLPTDVFPGKEISLKAGEKKIEDLDFIAKNKGTRTSEFYVQLNDDKTWLQVSRNTLWVNYNLKDIFKSNTYAYSILSPQLNLFSSIMSLLSYLG